MSSDLLKIYDKIWVPYPVRIDRKIYYIAL